MSKASNQPEDTCISASNERLDALLCSGHLDAHYQPIVDLHQGQPAGFEALARPHKDSGFAHPGELFDQASATQRLWEIEGFTRRTALSSCTDLLPHQRLFFNASPTVFADPRFPVSVLKEVTSTPNLNPSQIVIEITERTEDHAPDQLLSHVKELTAMGFQIAIDDVGAGTSGLNRIMLLRPHWLKLDRELVTGVDTDRVKQHLIRFIIQFSRLSGVNIIAEGIESEDELATLAQLGVHYAQGFFLARPNPHIAVFDDDHARRIRTIWYAAEKRRYRAPKEEMAVRFAKPTFTLSATDALTIALDLFEEKPNLPGVVIVDCDRLVGWCERSEIIEAHRTKKATRLCELARPVATIEAQETTVADMFELAACRPENEARRPLIVVDAGRVIGQLSPTDMIVAAAETIGLSTDRGTMFAGIPGRVQCDKHIHTLLLEHSLHVPQGANQPGIDVIFVDLQDFNTYNWTFGYDLGDKLLEHLSMHLKQLVEKTKTDVFLGHLGNDRFLITAPSRSLHEALERCICDFDNDMQNFSPSNDSAQQSNINMYSHMVRLRVLVIEDALRRVTDSHELFAMGDQLRRKAAGLEHATDGKPRGSHMLIDRIESDDPGRSKVA